MVEFNIGKTLIQGDVGTVFFAPIPKEVQWVKFNDDVEVKVEFTGKVNNYGEHAFRIISIEDNSTQTDEFDTSIGEEVEETDTKEYDVDLKSMTKKELVAYIEECNLDVDTNLSKAKILEKLIGA